MEVKNNKKILFDAETVKVLAATFRCHDKTVRNALNGVHCSEQSLRIRRRAIQLGLREKGEEQVTYLKR